VRSTIQLVAVALVAAIGSGCDENVSSIAGPTPNLVPTLSSIEQEIFSAADSSGRVACTSCHTDVNRVPPAGIVLLPGRAYDSLVNARALGKTGAILVVPGDPENSYLIHKLEGRADIAGLRMPRSGPPFLTDGQISIIKRWIETGAARN
jgi:hypothetical protein